MTKEEIEDNLGLSPEAVRLILRKTMSSKTDMTLSASLGWVLFPFMVADTVTVISRAFGSDQAYKWESQGVDGYIIEPCGKETTGTEIILKLRENSEEENYDEFLYEFRLKNLIKKYSDFIRYPIKMDLTVTKPKDGKENEYEQVVEEQIINSMVPIWRKNKNELTAEDYHNFYMEKHYGYDQPVKHIHIKADGMVSYTAILYIPEKYL